MSAVDRSGLPALGPERGFHFPEIRRRTLSSGLRAWTVQHRQVPLVTVLVVIPAGSAADPRDRPGLAAISGDMLDEGCGDRSAIDVHEALGRIGAQLDIEVGHDATVLGLTTLSRFLPRGLELLAEMIARPRFDQREFDRVRDLRLNRLLQLRDVPSALADRAFTELLFRQHPYGHLPIGTEGSLRAMTVREIAQFHKRIVTPERATVIAVGDASHAELADAVERAFDVWTRADAEGAANPDSYAPAPVPANRLAVVHRSAAAQSELRIGHVAVARSTPDYHALVVLNMVLGGQFVSRVNMNLREDKGYTYGARSAFEFRRAPGPFVLQASVQADATIEAVKEVFAEVRAIRGDRPVTAQELSLGRAALTRGYPRNFETADQIARAAAQLSLYDLPDDYFSTYVPKVLSLQPDDITRAAATYLDPSRLVAVIVGDRDKLAPALSTLELGDASEVALA